MKGFRILISGFCLLALAACAGPVTMSPQGSRPEIIQETERAKELIYKKMIEDQDRVFNVAFPVLAGNADFCGSRTVPDFGMTAWNLGTVRPEFRRAAANLYNLQPQLAVQHVADKSPAARAGIRSGDFIVAVNGETIPPTADARKIAYQALQRSGYNPAGILLERSGKTFETSVQPVISCGYPVILDYNSNDLNAYTDGRRIVLAKGLLRFTENNNELALVIAHELGHLAMRHIDKQQQNALIGGLGGLAVDSLLAAAGVGSSGQFSQLGQQMGALSYSVAFEQEADYVGMYFMERAGYNSSGVADFWRRFAAETPGSVSSRIDHPTSPERFIAIGHTHEEIAAKKSRGAELAPNFQPRR